jgi:hypothetical protein
MGWQAIKYRTGNGRFFRFFRRAIIAEAYSPPEAHTNDRILKNLSSAKNDKIDNVSARSLKNL